MPTTYGRPKLNPPAFLTSKSNGSSPTEFNQDWKQKLKDIDNDEYDGEMVREATSSTLTPLVSSSSLSAAPESQPLPHSSPPASPGHAYRDTEMTDDPDTSVELNTTVAVPSSDAEIEEQQHDTDTDDDEPVRRRMSKPLRVVDSDEETGPPKGLGKRRLVVASTSSAMSSGNDLSQMSMDRPTRSSNMTTPASSAQKPIKLALSDDSESDKEHKDEDEDRIEEASSPKVSRSMRKKGLNKAEKSEMAKTQQAIAASRDIRIPNASKRIDPKAFLSSYTASLSHTVQAEIDSYPFPPGARSQPNRSQDTKSNLRNKIAGMRPLSAHAAPKAKAKPPSSDPIVGSSQSTPAPGPAITDEEEDNSPEKASGVGLFGKPNALGMSMFGAGGPSDEEEEEEEDLPPVTSLLFPGAKAKPKMGLADEQRRQALADKKRAILEQQQQRMVDSESDSDIELEIGGPAKSKSKSTPRTLVRPGQSPAPTQSRKKKDELTESQVVRAGHAHHFGRDAAQLSSPAKGGGVYDDSQWGREHIPSLSARTLSGWASRQSMGGPRKSVGGGAISTGQLVKHAAKSAFVDGQAKQRADEDKWRKAGGRLVKRDKEGGLGVEDAVREALERADGQAEGEGDEEDEDEDDDDYRGSASEEEEEEEEDKENLPAAGRGRKPHEPVSDLEGSVQGDENGDEDKENSLELVGVGSPTVAGRSPARIDGESPALGRSPAHLNGLSPATHLNGLSPGRLIARSPSHPLGRSRLHSRVSSSGSGRLPLSELGDEDQGEAENAAVARAPLGELDVEVGADEEEEVVRRPTKRPRQSLARRLLDEDEDDDDAGVPSQKIGSRLGSPSQRRLGSPSQRRLGSPSQRKLGSPSQRRLGSPSQRFGSPGLRFSSPTPRAQPSRLRSPLPPSGTQSFSQVQTQDMLGGLGDVFGFESQAAPEKKDEEEGGGGLTQLFANAEAGKTSNAFAALRKDATDIELTQDERAKMLYKPVITDEELRRDQEMFEREDELMAMPFSPTQKEKETQMWLNEQGLWTQTRPAQSQMPSQLPPTTQIEEPKSTPIPATSLGTPSSLGSPGSEDGAQRQRIIRRGLVSGSASEEEDAPPTKIVSVLDRLMHNARDVAGKEKKKKDKKKIGKSEFVEGEAAESDDEYGDFGPRLRDEDEEDEDEDRHVEGLVDDQAMDEETEAAAHVQAKFMEQNAEEDAQREKVAREVVTGKHRTRRRGRDNMDLDDDDDESEEERRTGSKNLLKKRKIENDGLDELEKHESTRAFVQMYNKAIKSAEDDEFAHLNQVDDHLGGESELAADEYCEGGEEDEDEEDEGEDEGDQTLKEPETPFAPARTHIPSSAHAEISFGFKDSAFKFGDESDEEPTVDLPDAALRKGPSYIQGQPAANSRAQKWAAQEGGSSRANFSRVGQGVSVTGHNSKNKVTKTKSASSSRPAVSATSSITSSKLGRLGSKADGFR